jgi:uncharacterized surface protein with fasciclin (FAS1) repeats
MFMKIINRIKILSVAAAASLMLFTSCNRVDTAPTPSAIDTTTTGITLSATLAASAGDSLFNRMVVRSGLQSTLNVRTNRNTLIVPSNAAMRQFVAFASGGLVPAAAPDATHSKFLDSTLVVAPGVLGGLPKATAAAIVSYNILPQTVTSSSFPTGFPNLSYASTFNPAPALSSLLRLDVYLSKRNGNYVNNIPFTSVDVAAANGVIHKTPALNTPPSQYLWDRINTDPGLTYLKQAILRADSGVVAASTLQSALLNIGANLTVFAPTDAAFQATLTGAVYTGLVAQGYPAGAGTLATATALVNATDASGPTIFRNPLLYSVLTAQTVKGIAVYHLFGYRAFTNNFPTTQTFYPTLLNSAIPTHPGIGLTVTFTGGVVSAATVKGAVNASAANVAINPTPAPGGTSDQNYLNGTLHKIDQVLLPQ